MQHADHRGPGMAEEHCDGAVLETHGSSHRASPSMSKPPITRARIHDRCWPKQNIERSNVNVAAMATAVSEFSRKMVGSGVFAIP